MAEEESKDQNTTNTLAELKKASASSGSVPNEQIIKPTNKFTQGALHHLNSRDALSKIQNTRKKISYTSKLSKFKSNLFEKAYDIQMRLDVHFDPSKNMIRSQHNDVIKRKAKDTGDLAASNEFEFEFDTGGKEGKSSQSSESESASDSSSDI